MEVAVKISNCESMFVMCRSVRFGSRLWWNRSGLLEDRGVGFLLAVGVDWTCCGARVAGHDIDSVASDGGWNFDRSLEIDFLLSLGDT